MTECSREQFALLIAEYFDKWQFMQAAPQDWRKIVDNNPLVSSEYITTTINYHCAYLSNAQDCSIVIYDQQKAIAVWPLTLNKLTPPQSLQSNCKPILPPVFCSSVRKKQIKKVYQQCLSLIKHFSKMCKSDIKVSYLPNTDLLWQRTLAGNIKEVNYQQYLLTDLSQPLDDLKSEFRKSYRALINKGLKLWQCQVHERLSDDQLEEFRQFHITTAGKETRPILTWQLQQQMINKGEAFYISLRNDANKLVGAALFNLSPLQASYSVGVYDRALFEQPLGHAVQWQAMKYMQSKGVEKYLLGNRHHQFEQPRPTEKEMAIGFFKEGFSNDIVIEAQATLSF